jgi:hypothetical protein
MPKAFKNPAQHPVYLTRKALFFMQARRNPIHTHTLPAAAVLLCAWVDPTALSLGFFIQPFTAVGHR